MPASSNNSAADEDSEQLLGYGRKLAIELGGLSAPKLEATNPEDDLQKQIQVINHRLVLLFCLGAGRD